MRPRQTGCRKVAEDQGDIDKRNLRPIHLILKSNPHYSKSKIVPVLKAHAIVTFMWSEHKATGIIILHNTQGRVVSFTLQSFCAV
jgi:hypothetical protein